MNDRGFTLVELLIAVGVFVLIILFTVPTISKLGDSRAVPPNEQLTALLTSAARHARHGKNASAWGIYIPYDEGTRQTNTVVLFSGLSYVTRDTTYDIAFDFDDDALFTSVTLSGDAPSTGNDHEVVFLPLSGETTLFGTIVLVFRGANTPVTVSPSGFSTTAP